MTTMWWVLLLAGALGQQAATPPAAAPLDYDYFKTKVQPIFLFKRPGHARCVSCHSAGTPLRLQALLPGTTAWNDEQSRQNFETLKRVAIPGNPKSKLLLHPLEERAGGDFFHSGGKHFSSQDDPEWQVLRAWIMGQTTK